MHTFVAKLETGLGNILELKCLPVTEVLEHCTDARLSVSLSTSGNPALTDLIQWLSEQQHLIPSRRQLLHKHALREVLRGLAHIRQVEDLLLALLLVFDVLVERGHVPLVRCKTHESDELLLVPRVLNRAQFDSAAVNLLKLLKLGRVLCSDLLEGLDEAPDDDALDLLEEFSGLKGLARNVERQILSWERGQSLRIA